MTGDPRAWIAAVADTARGLRALIAQHLPRTLTVADRFACGHAAISRGCGGCDPGAVDMVLDDTGRVVWREEYGHDHPEAPASAHGRPAMTGDPRAWIAARRQITDAATAGPWRLAHTPEEDGSWYPTSDVLAPSTPEAIAAGADEEQELGDLFPLANAVFTVDARAALPAALAALSAVLDECDRLAALCPPDAWPDGGAVAASAVADTARGLRTLIAQHLPADADRG